MKPGRSDARVCIGLLRCREIAGLQCLPELGEFLLNAGIHLVHVRMHMAKLLAARL